MLKHLWLTVLKRILRCSSTDFRVWIRVSFGAYSWWFRSNFDSLRQAICWNIFLFSTFYFTLQLATSFPRMTRIKLISSNFWIISYHPMIMTISFVFPHDFIKRDIFKFWQWRLRGLFLRFIFDDLDSLWMGSFALF